MAQIGFLERKLTTLVSPIVERSKRARRIIRNIRDERGIYHNIHGKLKDTRPLPSVPILTSTMMADRMERSIRHVVEWPVIHEDDIKMLMQRGRNGTIRVCSSIMSHWSSKQATAETEPRPSSETR